MSKTYVNEKTARPARTLVQAGPAVVIVGAVDEFIWDMSDSQATALVALLITVFSWLMPLIENKIGKGFGRYVDVEKVPVESMRP